MLNIQDKTLCCGCGACLNICPRNAIKMQPDNEGFLYPIVDEDLCIKCGKCLKVCPILNSPDKNSKYIAYACKNKIPAERENSSSGGVFYAAAKYIIALKGVVFGADFDKDFKVYHTFASTEEELEGLRRSKYVQSDTGLTFRKVKEFLDKDKYVLFCGTPCQIGGLRNYLGQDYGKLFCADIICHGVPSPEVWKVFLEQNFKISSLKAVNFRYKKYGWMNFFLNFNFKNGKESCGPVPLTDRIFGVMTRIGKLKTFFTAVYRNYFLRAFLGELCNRPSCHDCAFKGAPRASDITLGDLWGIEKSAPDMYDEKGVSLILINTVRGAELFNALKPYFSYKEIDFYLASKANAAFYFSTVPHKNRADFFAKYKTVPLNKLIKKLLHQKPAIFNFALRLMRYCLKLIRK